MKEEVVRHNNTTHFTPRRSLRRVGAFALALVSAAILIVCMFSFEVKAGEGVPIPSNVAWTAETIAEASSGDSFRGMLLARRCEHCHGAEGFSPVAFTPNLASMNKLTVWKQLQDFSAGKRQSRIMVPIAQSLSSLDIADLAAYYSTLPVFPDPQDNRVFPESPTGPSHQEMASRLITFGDGERGIPPCESCHGPVAFKTGAPSLSTQNADYLLNQLEAFSKRQRTNDVNEPMRTIAGLLSEEERHALAEYYGAGLGLQPSSASGAPLHNN